MDLDIIVSRIAESKIREAKEEGKFDNLPGKGQPIVFDDDPMTPPHLRLVNKILKNANVVPEFIQIQRDIESERQETEKLRAKLVRENQQRQKRLHEHSPSPTALTQYAEWHTKSRTAYLRQLKSVNVFILKFSMVAPSTAAPLFPYKITQEMEAFDVLFPPLPQQPEVMVEETHSNSVLRTLARSQYKKNQD